VILTYLAIAVNEAFFCDCYRNMGHFLCSVERIKRFVNVHLHRHSSAMFLLRGANTQDQNLQHFKAMEKHANKKLFGWNVYFVRILIRLYVYYIIHKIC